MITATPGVLTLNADNLLFGSITITGERLGGVDDAIFLAFYRDGIVALNLEVIGTALQNVLVVNVSTANALAPGTYYLILRVNGAQATHTPEVNWTL